ncbi:hypothetical protein [Bradyrhizobium sp.]|uniref:hypothetical protein n=1 Tax=Bradyrhizobium sp. TaxID=376 RepID=UPI00262E5BFF|nr:hypothetical protein [Bradyrhizobium sp.]
MVRQDPSSISEGELVTTEGAEGAPHAEMLREQLKSSERLTEYYNQVVAELRASLERIEQGDQAS